MEIMSIVQTAETNDLSKTDLGPARKKLKDLTDSDFQAELNQMGLLAQTVEPPKVDVPAKTLGSELLSSQPLSKEGNASNTLPVESDPTMNWKSFGNLEKSTEPKTSKEIRESNLASIDQGSLS